MKKKGFTLVELLVVISIIALLLSILVPSLQKARNQARKIVCGSRLKQIGTAFFLYGSDNDAYFPYNQLSKPDWWVNSKTHFYQGGYHLSRNSSVVVKFWETYLVKLDASVNKGKSNVLYCPTNQIHNYSAGEDSRLIGYFYLPYRLPSSATIATGTDAQNYTHTNYQPPENPRGNRWVSKKKIGLNDSTTTPIVTDMKLAFGDASVANRWWCARAQTKAVPYSNHAGPSGEPEGGNFLYEDGHVKWFNNDKIELGAFAATRSEYNFYYKVP